MSNNMLDILKNFDRASNPVSECGMEGGVSLQASDAAQMAEILKAIAGVEAGDKPDMPAMDMPMDMPVKMKLPMGEPEEAEMEDYDNEPEEEYMDMDDVITSGDDLHRKKDPKAVRVKDPAVESSIKDRLWAALNEKKETCNECGKQMLTAQEKQELADLEEGKRHGNSAIYKKCWKGCRKVAGVPRGQPGSCKCD